MHLYVLCGAAGSVFLISIAIAITVVIKCRTNNTYILRKGMESKSVQLNEFGPKNEPSALNTTITNINKGNATFSLEKQFEELELNDERRKRHYPCNIGLRYCSKNPSRSLNVDPEVIPYDATRVVLKTPIKNSDYINATWMNKAAKEGDYATPTMTSYVPYSKLNVILTQDPMPQTMAHYYQMIYDNYVDVVIQICSRDDFDTKEIHFETHQTILNFDIKTTSANLLTAFLVKRSVEIHNNEQDYKQTYSLIQFIDWPKMIVQPAVNEDRKKFLSAISLIRKMIGKGKSTVNMVVQDNKGGVGGAAVYVALLQLMQAVDESIESANADGELSSDQLTSLNVFQTVNMMRKNRAKLVRTFDEYTFMTHCLLEYVQDNAYFDNLVVDDFYASAVREKSMYVT